MRQLCNVAYAMMVEGLDEDGRQLLDGKLSTPPGQAPPPNMRGTEQLMQMLGPGGMARRR